jgi:hypothetical protein
VRGITPTPVKHFRALDPRRSLPTAVAWLAVAVSLATAAALLAVGTFAAAPVHEAPELSARPAHG